MREFGMITGIIPGLSVLTITLLLSGSALKGQTITADFSYEQACETFNFKDKSTSTGGGIFSWFWDFGDTYTSTDTDPIHSYSVSGEYLVSLTVVHEDPTITDTYTETVEYFYPEAGFTFTNNCSAFSFLDTSTPFDELDSAFWYFGEGDTLKLYTQPFDADYNYISEGEYEVFLIAFAKGCSDTASDTVSFYVPEATFDFSNTCADFEFVNQSVVTEGELTYLWNFGDSYTSADTNPAHTYLNEGEYEVTLIAYHPSGCSDTMVQTVSFYEPAPDFSFAGNCSYFEFYDGSAPIGGIVVSWQWNFGDGTGFSTNQNPAYTYSSPGTYPVKLVAAHESGCIDSITKMISFEYPEASFTFTNVCESFEFTNTSTPISEIDSVHWYLGEGDTIRLYSQPFDVSYDYTAEGEYEVFLKVFNEDGCSDSFLDTVSFYHPQAAFTFTHVCGDFQFTNTSTVATGEMTWFWDFDDGNTSTEENPVYSYVSPGDYEVTLTVTHESGCESATSEVVSFYKPIAMFSHDAPCFGTQTCFYDESIPNATSITNWYWDFGTGITSGIPDPCYIYAVPDQYIVTLSVKNSTGCISEPHTDTLNVDLAPEADFSAEIACFHDTSYFINQSDTHNIPVAFWLWDFGDPGSGVNNTSSLFEPGHVFSTEGPFGVALTVENINGCVSTVVKNFVVDSIPDAAFAAPDTIAVNVEITFEDNSLEHGNPILYRFWDFGDGITALNPNPVVHTYDEPGEYLVCLIVTDVDGCVDTACSTIIVTDTPHADFIYSTGSDLITHFLDDSFTEATIIDWYWDFGDPLSVNDTANGIPDPTYTYPYAGYFPVYLKIYDIHSGIHDTTKIIYVGTALVADFQATDVCHQDTTVLTDLSYTIVTAEFDSWEWDFGDGTDSTYYEFTNPMKHFYADPGSYDVRLIVTGNISGAVSKDTINKEVSVYEYPVARIDSMNMIACLGQQIHFTDSSYTLDGDTISNWLWNFGDGSSSSAQNPSHLYVNIQNYMVTLTISTLHGCSASDTVGSKITTSPDINFNIVNPCVNSEAVFVHTDSDIEITEWFWDMGDPYSSGPDTSTLEEPSHIYTRVDQYKVKMYASSYGCSKTLERTFVIKPIPFSEYTFISNYQGVQGRTIFDNSSVYATHYLWDFGNGHTSSVEDPIEVFEKDSTYLVTLISTNEYGCSDTSRHEVLVFFKGLYFPTAFSPNNPYPEVSKFTPKGINLSTYEVQVFDLRGSLLWESSKLDTDGSPLESWDGYYNGVLMPEGVYVWKAQGVFRDGTIWKGSEIQTVNPQTHGTVTLIR